MAGTEPASVTLFRQSQSDSDDEGEKEQLEQLDPTIKQKLLKIVKKQKVVKAQVGKDQVIRKIRTLIKRRETRRGSLSRLCCKKGEELGTARKYIEA